MSRHLAARVVRWAGLVYLFAAVAAPGAGSGQSPGVPRQAAAGQAVSAKLAAQPEAGKGEATLPPGTSQDWWTKVQQDIQQQEYSVTWSKKTPLPGEKGAWQAPNRAQGFRTYFTKEGIRLVPRTEEKPSWAWGLELARWGREGAWQDATAAEPRAEANRVTLDRPGIQEWYLNDERGLEQGFTIPSPPVAADAVSPHSSLLTPHYLSIDLALSGTLRPVISEDGQAVDFYGDGSFNVLRYAQLKVTDASGRDLPARFVGVSSLLTPHPSLLTAASGGIRISIDDSSASYPITVDPLATTPAWTAEGDRDYASFGYSLATAGDVNGDGYSDVIVGACSYADDQSNEGRAYVFLGSASGLASTAAWTADGNQAGAQFGWSVATAGDVNRDGYSDVIVGAYYYSNGQNHEGRAYVFLGSASGLAGTAAWTAEGDQDDAAFGWSVGTAGDVNGDGYSDVIVGAYYYSNGQNYEGRAYVYLGSASGLAGTAAWTAEGDKVGASFGSSVATAGDVNGDGYADVIVGAFGYTNDQNYEGRASVFMGSASGLAGAAAWTAEGDQVGAYFGWSVATAGDVNGDGYSDTIVGAINSTGGENFEGRAYVFLGSASGLASTAAWRAESDQSNASFGWSVSTAGDVNGDGYADVLVAAYTYDHGQTDEGAAFLWLGSASGLGADGTPANADWTAEGNRDSAGFGCSVATAGDVNGDGNSDVLVGAPYYANGNTAEGAAYLYLGGAGSLTAGTAWGPGVGISAGDVNGDGYDDVIVGDPGYSNPEVEEGAAYVYYGSAAGLSTTPSWMIEGGEENAELGTQVAAAGDVNGDGYGDVLVTTYAYFDPTTHTYFAPCLYLGGPSGLSSTPAWVGLGNDTPPEPLLMDAQFLSAGDVNGDGYWDVVVASGSVGGTLVYFGGASGLSAVPDRTLTAGALLWAAGDMNRDGYSDILGSQHLYLGSAFGPGYAPAWIATGYAALAGDVNGDGYSDVLVVDTWATRPETPEEPWTVSQAGAVYLYLGGSSGPAASPSWAVYGQCEDAHFPDGAGAAGDVNGDGYADLFVGYDPSLHDPPGVCDPYWPQEQLALYLGGPSGFPSSPSWTTAGVHGGCAVGDVNRDGYSDVLVGGLLYYGNGGPCLTSGPVQRRRDGSAPVAPLGSVGESGRFRAGLTGRTPFGRGQFKLEWEAKPLSTPFDGSGTGQTTSWQDTGLAGVYWEDQVTGLAVDTVYHWRVRPRYNPVTTPFQSAGRWVSIPWNGPGETDLRTGFGEADAWATQTDTDPALIGGPLVYTVTAGNAGSDPARLVLEGARTLGTSTFVSAVPSQGRCDYSEALGLSCDLGTVASGGSVTVAVTFTPTATGTHGWHSAVSTFAQDPNSANNACDETTAVVAPAIGNLVWGDIDGDGIQDAGETGLAGVVVQLYDSTYTWLAQKVTNASGFYQFTAVTVGNSYFVKVIPPSASYVFSQPNQGADDTLDSDVDTATGQTPIFSLLDGRDPARWDAGLVYGITCDPPDEAVWIYMVTKSVPDNYPILNFQDPNQPGQRTGWNIRRTDNPALPKNTWPLIGSNVVDMDQGTPNYQYTDITGAVGTWYYQVTAYNAYCPAEGPF